MARDCDLVMLTLEFPDRDPNTVVCSSREEGMCFVNLWMSLVGTWPSRCGPSGSGLGLMTTGATVLALSTSCQKKIHHREKDGVWYNKTLNSGSTFEMTATTAQVSGVKQKFQSREPMQPYEVLDRWNIDFEDHRQPHFASSALTSGWLSLGSVKLKVLDDAYTSHLHVQTPTSFGNVQSQVIRSRVAGNAPMDDPSKSDGQKLVRPFCLGGLHCYSKPVLEPRVRMLISSHQRNDITNVQGLIWPQTGENKPMARPQRYLFLLHGKREASSSSHLIVNPNPRSLAQSFKPQFKGPNNLSSPQTALLPPDPDGCKTSVIANIDANGCISASTATMTEYDLVMYRMITDWKCVVNAAWLFTNMPQLQRRYLMPTLPRLLADIALRQKPAGT
ncbi:hypothetical protein V8F06_007698 [Rhypophila decipiens]